MGQQRRETGDDEGLGIDRVLRVQGLLDGGVLPEGGVDVHGPGPLHRSAVRPTAHRVRLIRTVSASVGFSPRHLSPSYSNSVSLVGVNAVNTARLHLRAHQREDASALHAIYRRPEVARYLLDEPWSAEEAAARVEERLSHTGLDAEAGAWALIIEHDGAVVGDVLLWLTDREHCLAEIGWVLDPASSGRGFAAEAVTEVLRRGFEHHRLHRIAAQMDARNTASARLAARVGMMPEAYLRQNWWSKGEWTDTLIYARLREDPASEDPAWEDPAPSDVIHR